jgi:hypothetical protein
MNKPVPAPIMPVGGNREPAGARLDQGHARSGGFSLSVRFYRAMKPNRVYPLVVEMPRATAKVGSGGTAPLMVKPIIGGAVVAPAEQALEMSPNGGQVTFQVTPVAKGRLKDARVEVSQQGRQVESIPLKMKTRTQRLTWFLLLLTLILPVIMAYFTSIAPLSGDVPGVATRRVADPTLPVPPREDAPPGRIAPARPQPNEGRPPAPAGGGAVAAIREPIFGQVVELRPGTPGENLQFKISHVIHKNCPKLDDLDLGFYTIPLSKLCAEKANYSVTDQPHDLVESVASWLGDQYQFLYIGASDLYPAFYLAMGLGALTLLSLVTHTTARRKTRRMNIRLHDSASAGHVRSASSREESPVVVEAAD